MHDGTVHIDSTGRLVLPKPIRKRFNLVPGDKLRLAADDTGIRLEPVQPAGKLIRKGTRLIFRGEFSEPITTELVENLIDEDRNRATAFRGKPKSK